MRDADRDDLELHRGLAAGDQEAFDALYRRYASSAYGLAYRITGQQVLAQDVVHDAFMALWRAPEAYDPARGAFRTFFLSLVHHRAVDTVRREQRMRARQERASNLEPVTVEDPAEGVTDAAGRRILLMQDNENRLAHGVKKVSLPRQAPSDMLRATSS